MLRNSPASPISPKTTVSSLMGVSFKLDIRANAIAKSTAGSSRRRPPTTLIYVSKFEKILDNKTSKDEHSAVKKSFKRKDEDEPKRKTTFDLSKKDYELKPIYTEEELEEIARQEAEEQENDWINDDIDFDEYDQYYEE